jgi:hypothetical protein
MNSLLLHLLKLFLAVSAAVTCVSCTSNRPGTKEPSGAVTQVELGIDRPRSGAWSILLTREGGLLERRNPNATTQLGTTAWDTFTAKASPADLNAFAGLASSYGQLVPDHTPRVLKLVYTHGSKEVTLRYVHSTSYTPASSEERAAVTTFTRLWLAGCEAASPELYAQEYNFLAEWL